MLDRKAAERIERMKIGITDIATSNLIASTECWGDAGLLSLNDCRSHFLSNILGRPKSYPFWVHFYAGVKTNRKEKPQ